MPTTSPRSVVRFRPAGERFHTQLPWLNSWHSFSFSSHHDPEWMGFGPLLVINDDVIAAGQGFGMHPHRDMEIITVMVDGEVTHADSMGNSAVLRAPEVQRMSAGTGVLHSEINRSSQHCRLLQIWVEPSRKGGDPSYEQKPFALSTGWTCLIEPQAQGEAMAIQRPVRLWRSRPQAGDQLQLPVQRERLAWLQLIDGSASLGAHQLQRGDGLGFSTDGLQQLSVGAEGADLLLFELQ